MIMNREDRIHAARVYLSQARHFMRRHRSFAFTLLDWAAKARRSAAAMISPQVPQQMSLFANTERKEAAT